MNSETSTNQSGIKIHSTEDRKDNGCIVLELFMKSKHTVDITRDEAYRSMSARDKQCVTI